METGIHRLLQSEEIEGERRANQVRLYILALFLVVYFGFYLKSERHYTAGYVILADLVALLVYSLAIRQFLAGGRYHRSIKYISTAADIACITIIAISSLYLSSGPKLSGWVTNIAVFPLFTALSGLRLIPALPVFTGFVTALAFVLLNQFVTIAGGEPLPFAQLITVMVLLLAEGGVVAFIALTARRLIVRAGLAERQQAQLATEASYARSLAETDDLTGLYNRRHFMTALRRQLTSYAASGRPFALLIIDLDNFKAVNDTFGHLAGDQAIRQVAALLRSSSRATDIVARFGGDEFGVILPNSTPHPALMAAERLCRAVSEHRFQVEGDSRGFYLSLSIGMACCPGDSADIEDLLRMADHAVYQAKAKGRDRVVGAQA